jgi:hypothetical protein
MASVILVKPAVTPRAAAPFRTTPLAIAQNARELAPDRSARFGIVTGTLLGRPPGDGAALAWLAMPDFEKPLPDHWADLARGLWGNAHGISIPPDNALRDEALALETDFAEMLVDAARASRWEAMATSIRGALHGDTVPLSTFHIAGIRLAPATGDLTLNRAPLLRGLLWRPLDRPTPAELVAQHSSARQAYEAARELGLAGQSGYSRDALRMLFNRCRSTRR